jgi:4-hydroxysphinganine ceramide fatty acyl 2-hydroxylase
MPGRTLPSLTPAEIKSHNTAKSCYVTRGSKVYDVTSFIDDHPGGGDLILEHAGTDVSDILADPLSHQHSEAAYEILDECHIGFVSHDPSTPSKTNGDGAVKGPAEAEHVVHENGRPVYASTGMAGEEDLSVETDPNADYQRHKFLDLSKPLFPQLWYGGFSKDFYLDQVHRPRHYRGGASAPLFGNFLEPLSKTPWWVVPLVWLPCVAYASSVGFSGLDTTAERCGYWIFGVAFWTLIEYTLHRCLFHIDKSVSPLLNGLPTLSTNCRATQVSSRQSSRRVSPFPPPRYPPLFADG